MDLSLFLEYQRTKDLKIRNRLIMANLGIIYKVMRGNRVIDDVGDLFQAGVIGLIEAIDRWNPGQGSFYTIARWRVLHQLQECIRKRHGSAHRNGSAERCTAADGAISLGGRVWGAAVDGGYEAVDARHDLAKALRGASPGEIKAMLATADDATPTESAAALGMRRGRDSGEIIAGALARARYTLESDE